MAIKTKAQLLLQNEQFIKDNTNREITEEILRNHLADIIDSAQNINESQKSFGEIILNEFVIPTGTDYDSTFHNVINSRFFDYGAGGGNSVHYSRCIFEIKNFSSVIVYNGQFADITEFYNWFGTRPILPLNENLFVKVYFNAKEQEPKITARNEFYNLIRGGRYFDTDIFTMADVPNPTAFNSLLQSINAQLIPAIVVHDKKMFCFSRVNRQLNVGMKITNSLKKIFTGNESPFKRKVWNLSTLTHQDLSVVPASPWGTNSHSAIAILDNAIPFNYRVVTARSKVHEFYSNFNGKSLLQVTKFINGNYQLYYIKPMGVDLFEATKYDTNNYDMYCILYNKIGKAVIRKIDVEDIEDFEDNKSVRFRKVDIFKKNYLKRGTNMKNVSASQYSKAKFFYLATDGNGSKLSKQIIEVETKKRGRTIGLGMRTEV